MKDDIFVKEIISEDTALAASGTYENTSDPILFEKNVGKAGRNGNLSFWLKFTGSGTLKVEAKCSGNRGDDYVTITPELSTGLAAGNHLVAFAVPICTHMTLLITEEGVDTVTINELNVISR